MHAQIIIQAEEFWLLPEKAMYWPAQKIMVVADVHLGKAAHFRKNGVAMPTDAASIELQKLNKLLAAHQVQHLVFLGDLFHAQPNHEWQVFEDWLALLQEVNVTLVRGNHDIFLDKDNPLAYIQVCEDLTIGNFIFTHEPLQTIAEGKYNLSGHIHPGVKLSGKGKQSVRLPCFWMGAYQGILPAFGSLTGTMPLPTKNARVFAVASQEVIEV